MKATLLREARIKLATTGHSTFKELELTSGNIGFICRKCFRKGIAQTASVNTSLSYLHGDIFETTCRPLYGCSLIEQQEAGD